MSSSFALGEHFEALVRDLVASGRFRDASEVVQAGLRLLEDREADLDTRRMALMASFEQQLADVEAGNGVPVDDVDAHFERRRAGGERFSR